MFSSICIHMLRLICSVILELFSWLIDKGFCFTVEQYSLSSRMVDEASSSFGRQRPGYAFIELRVNRRQIVHALRSSQGAKSKFILFHWLCFLQYWISWCRRWRYWHESLVLSWRLQWISRILLQSCCCEVIHRRRTPSVLLHHKVVVICHASWYICSGWRVQLTRWWRMFGSRTVHVRMLWTERRRQTAIQAVGMVITVRAVVAIAPVWIEYRIDIFFCWIRIKIVIKTGTAHWTCTLQ